ncbi:leucine-rich repeat domain-containing protein [Croceitalea marina]|uniref:Leucine-rich repeat domain-containing protein n=1 Tax=Croceitalea marina TaxID=1775166 RepID=A0ABW5MUH4_9FLAO
MKQLKSVLFITSHWVLVHYENHRFLVDLEECTALHHFQKEIGIEVFATSLSPNRKRLVLSNLGAQATIWDLEKNEIRQLGGVTLNTQVLGWVDDNHPIFSGNHGGAGTINLNELLGYPAEELEEYMGWNPGFKGLKYYEDELLVDDMIRESPVEYFTSDIWEYDGKKTVVETLDGSKDFNLYTITDTIHHEVKRYAIEGLEYPKVSVCNDNLVVLNLNELHVFDLRTAKQLGTYTLPKKNASIQTDIERTRIFTYCDDKLEQWNLDTGEKVSVWTGRKLMGFSISGSKCILYKDNNQIQVLDMETKTVQQLLDINESKKSVKINIIKVGRSDTSEDIYKLLDTENESQLNKAFRLIAKLSEDEQTKFSSRIRNYPFQCLVAGLELPYFKNLKQLDLSRKNLKLLSRRIGMLEQLEILDLSSNNLRDLPQEIKNLKRLKTLKICYNNFKKLPEFLSEMPQLQHLDVFCNNVKVIPPWIDQLKHLEVLDLNMNRIKESPKALYSLKNLRVLNLKNNTIKTLPSEVGKLGQLTHLYLEKNELSELPDALFKLAKLEELDLYDNQIRVMPDKLRQLKALKRLMLHNNELRHFPNVLSELKELKDLILTQNSISKEDKKIIKKNAPKECRITF